MNYDLYIKDMLWELWYKPLLTTASFSGSTDCGDNAACPSGFQHKKRQSLAASGNAMGQEPIHGDEEKKQNCLDAAWNYYCRLLPIWDRADKSANAIDRLSFGNA